MLLYWAGNNNEGGEGGAGGVRIQGWRKKAGVFGEEHRK